ncbi:agmatine deiminase family protein [Sunxiuqinia dokdonensis]|uniref:agmatine deiminase family protein n=1 Tax=Sunxiuqinia dokdonensis TaxID=1409788 RepID=UPI00069E848F|nr:agmatine deiminase family protein [Sunxiuqinia dokdonensis]
MSLKSGLLLLLLFPFCVASPQVSNPRHPAEWEEIRGVVMGFRYFKNPNVSWDEAFDPFIKTARACIDEGIDFYIVELPESQSKNPVPIRLDTVFSNRNIDSPLVHIITIDSLSNTLPWVRDHGMYQIYQNEVGDRLFFNFPDDQTGRFMAKFLDIPSEIIHSEMADNYYTDGGNFLTDGHGTFNIAATNTSEKLPAGLLEEYDYFYQNFGIKKTLNLSTSFVHVDYFIKLIDEETALIAYIPNSNYDISIDEFYDDQHAIDQAVISISQQLESAYGREIKFVPIQNAPTSYDRDTKIVLNTSKATYINSIIINKTVLVPQYDVKLYDERALEAYRKAMPGYNIVGVACRQYAHLAGAIHCLTHEIYADNPIYVRHKWLQGKLSHHPGGYPVNVIAKSSDGIQTVNLHWRANEQGEFSSVPMVSTKNDQFQATIPAAKSGTPIDYYIEIQNNNGKRIHKPQVAPTDSYSFSIQ